jgi:hypothetical protein
MPGTETIVEERQVRYPTKDGGGVNQGFYTLRELRNALRLETDRLQEQGDLRTETSRGTQTPDKTDLLNWVLTGFLGMPVAERDRIIRRGKRRFEAVQRAEPLTIDLTTPHGDDPAAAPDVKGFPTRGIQPRKDRGKGKDLAPATMHAPGG